ncbi:MAG: phage/plasmid replication protein, II/X family [Gammaproteobacteria bacterium]|nr:phage/plasmid replication protein, II/X family [Gammaproteobacteria bacterium]
MIDWITAIVPCEGAGELAGGKILCVDADGQVEWQSNRRLSVEGSYSSKFQVKADDQQRLWISGNPSKFLQGHSVFGSNDLKQLVLLLMIELTDRLQLEPSSDNFYAWQAGNYDLKCVDIAECFRLDSSSLVENWIRSAAPLARGKHQGVSAYGGETIYVGQKSRRISLKIYNKGKEILKHKPDKNLPCYHKLIEYAQGLLRVEVRLHSQELKRRDLNKAAQWAPSICTKILEERIGRLEMPKKMRLTATEISKLPPRLVGAVKLWEAGNDLRSIYPRATFYRYRGELKKYGIDISAPPRTESNVVPLVTYLTAEHQADIPEWAVGTELIACA